MNSFLINNLFLFSFLFERRNVAAAAPAVRADGEQDVVAVLIDDADVLQRDDRTGVGHMEDVAVLAGQTSVVLH